MWQKKKAPKKPHLTAIPKNKLKKSLLFWHKGVDITTFVCYSLFSECADTYVFVRFLIEGKNGLAR